MVSYDNEETRYVLCAIGIIYCSILLILSTFNFWIINRELNIIISIRIYSTLHLIFYIIYYIASMVTIDYTFKIIEWQIWRQIRHGSLIIASNLFYAIILSRLYYSFRDTQFHLSKCTLCIYYILLTIFTILLYIYYWFRTFDRNNTSFEYSYFLFAASALNLGIGYSFIYLFIRKLYRLAIQQKQSINWLIGGDFEVIGGGHSNLDDMQLHSLNDDGDINDNTFDYSPQFTYTKKTNLSTYSIADIIDEVEVTPRQLSLLRAIVKNTILLAVAITLFQVPMVFVATYHQFAIYDESFSLIAWFLNLAAVCIEVICIYMTFQFNARCYLGICGLCDKFCLNLLKGFMLKNMKKKTKMDMTRYTTLADGNNTIQINTFQTNGHKNSTMREIVL